MPSQVWERDPQEAFENPYEYEIQDQFVREARSLFPRLYHLLNSDHHRYSVEDRSRQKAVWLLAMDALDSLRDCLKALTRKEHRIAGKLFRDVVENMDLAEYFHSGTDKSVSFLVKWYADKIVPHRCYRDYVKRTRSEQEAKRLAKHYSSLSCFTHRSYRAILDGYSRGGGNRLVHDGIGEMYGNGENSTTSLVLPQTIASYYAVLANLVLEYTTELSELGLVTLDEVRDAFAKSLEEGTVPRRFLPRRRLAEGPRDSTADEQDEE